MHNNIRKIRFRSSFVHEHGLSRSAILLTDLKCYVHDVSHAALCYRIVSLVVTVAAVLLKFFMTKIGNIILHPTV